MLQRRNHTESYGIIRNHTAGVILAGSDSVHRPRGIMLQCWNKPGLEIHVSSLEDWPGCFLWSKQTSSRQNSNFCFLSFFLRQFLLRRRRKRYVETVLASRKLFVERRRRWKGTTQQFVRLQFKLKQFISCCGGAATINELTHKSTCN